ncbi:hypothetical protein F511_12571 [Dorcoceras hygrometricum]|uniref:Uncharacterized protein n=1 Tax=Dorcoceras hygrometricum TaxID=472368 RepID=A0A2Z7D9F8_9LAMI|nr:hypothetical protein F511_12571 [Dorcoceras hygrometricum]
MHRKLKTVYYGLNVVCVSVLRCIPKLVSALGSKLVDGYCRSDHGSPVLHIPFSEPVVGQKSDHDDGQAYDFLRFLESWTLIQIAVSVEKGVAWWLIERFCRDFSTRLEKAKDGWTELFVSARKLSHVGVLLSLTSCVYGAELITYSFLDWTVKMRIRPPELETSICDVKYHVSLTLSVIPRGSWGDVARRFTMIRWASPKMWFRSHTCCGSTASCIPEPLRVTQVSLIVPARTSRSWLAYSTVLSTQISRSDQRPLVNRESLEIQ